MKLSVQNMTAYCTASLLACHTRMNDDAYSCVQADVRAERRRSLSTVPSSVPLWTRRRRTRQQCDLPATGLAHSRAHSDTTAVNRPHPDGRENDIFNCAPADLLSADAATECRRRYSQPFIVATSRRRWSSISSLSWQPIAAAAATNRRVLFACCYPVRKRYFSEFLLVPKQPNTDFAFTSRALN